MRAALAALVLFAAGCASSGGGERTSSWDAPLSPDLFPFDVAPATFADSKGAAPGTMRVEPAPGGETARVVFESAGAVVGEMRVTRRGDSIFFASGAGAETELIRGGAKPGDAWESERQRIRFEGWERVTLPPKSYDAARITVRRGSAKFELVETWWFARGVGLVRQRTDRGSMSVRERSRVPQ
jgi:hypothetical protein